MAARSSLGVGLGVALAIAIACPVSHASEAQATGQGVTIGVTVGTLSEIDRERIGYSADGVVVTGVVEGGAAERGGIVPGDILVVIGTTTLRSVLDLDKAVAKLRAGEEVAAVIARQGGRSIKVMNLVPDAVAPAPEAEIAPEPSDEDATPPVPWEHAASPAETPAPVEGTSPAILGVECRDLDADLAAALGAKTATGALVLRVEPESPAALAGIRAGDVVAAVGDEPVRGVEHLSEALGRLGRAPAWRVERRGEAREVSLAPPPPPPAPAVAAPEATAPEAGTVDDEREATLAELRHEVEALRGEVRRLRRQIDRLRESSE